MINLVKNAIKFTKTVPDDSHVTEILPERVCSDWSACGLKIVVFDRDQQCLKILGSVGDGFDCSYLMTFKSFVSLHLNALLPSVLLFPFLNL